VILSKGKKLGLDDLPDALAVDTPPSGGHQTMFSLPEGCFKLKEVEKELIRTTLAHCSGNKSHAAQQLGISRKTLYEKIARYMIK